MIYFTHTIFPENPICLIEYMEINFQEPVFFHRTDINFSESHRIDTKFDKLFPKQILPILTLYRNFMRYLLSIELMQKKNFQNNNPL